MGVSDQYPLLEVVPLDLKDTTEDQNKALEGSDEGIMKRRVVSRRTSSGHIRSNKRPKRILMKRKHLGGASRRRSGNGIVRRVQTLKRLVPTSRRSEGLDGLFRETADYILSLQMRVRVMHIMVKVLSGSEE